MLVVLSTSGISGRVVLGSNSVWTAAAEAKESAMD